MNSATTMWVTQVKPSFPLHSFLLYIGSFMFLVLVAVTPAIIIYCSKYFARKEVTK